MKQTISLLFIGLSVMLSACTSAEKNTPNSTDAQDVVQSQLREISLPTGWTLKELSPQYKMVEEEIEIEQSPELLTIPAEFKWVEGEIEGFTVHHPLPTVIMKPAVYEIVTETVVVQQAYTKLSLKPETLDENGSAASKMKVVEEHVPAITKQVSKRVIKTPAEPYDPIEHAEHIEKMKTKNVIKDGRTRILVKPAKVIKRDFPAVMKTVKRRVRSENETYILMDENGKAVEYIKNFDELMAFHKTHLAP